MSKSKIKEAVEAFDVEDELEKLRARFGEYLYRQLLESLGDEDAAYDIASVIAEKLELKVRVPNWVFQVEEENIGESENETSA